MWCSLSSFQVFVGSFTPIPANMIPEEMEEMVKWLNEDESLLLDPIERAAIAHYKLVRLLHIFQKFAFPNYLL